MIRVYVRVTMGMADYFENEINRDCRKNRILSERDVRFSREETNNFNCFLKYISQLRHIIFIFFSNFLLCLFVFPEHCGKTSGVLGVANKKFVSFRAVPMSFQHVPPAVLHCVCFSILSR